MPLNVVRREGSTRRSDITGEYDQATGLAQPESHKAVAMGLGRGKPLDLTPYLPAGSRFLSEPLTTPSADDPSAISLLSKDAFERFRNICNILESPVSTKDNRSYDRELTLLSMQDARARFKAWGESIAAFHNGTAPTSLDFRLKQAPEVRRRALQILEYLQEYLYEVTLIIVGMKLNGPLASEMSDSSDQSSDEEADHSQEVIHSDHLKGKQAEKSEKSELDELLSAIIASNKSLMKLSMVIRSSPARDDYNKAASRYKDWNPYADIGHVREKHGSAKGSTDWLINRLGSAIARRRQFLKYRIEHAEKMAGGWEDEEKPQEGHKPEKTIASTKATTFLGNDVVYQKAESDTAISFGSQTSYEHTVAGEESAVTKLTVPKPPKFAFPDVSFEYGEPFNCPYCYTVQNVKNKTAWKKHVFRDLKPYVCTFRECSMMMFRSRNEWFAHELQNHRRKWVCQYCQHAPFSTSTNFSTHISSSHSAVLATTQIEALILQSEEAVENLSASACPLCNEWQDTVAKRQRNQEESLNVRADGEAIEPYGTKKQFRRHLGRHMEQLALFALPKTDVDMDDDSTQGDGEENSDQELDHSSLENETRSAHPPEQPESTGVDPLALSLAQLELNKPRISNDDESDDGFQEVGELQHSNLSGESQPAEEGERRRPRRAAAPVWRFEISESEIEVASLAPAPGGKSGAATKVVEKSDNIPSKQQKKVDRGRGDHEESAPPNTATTTASYGDTTSRVTANLSQIFEPRREDVPLKCPRCTFANHPLLRACEMCGAQLISSDILGQENPSNSGAAYLGSRIKALETMERSERRSKLDSKVAEDTAISPLVEQAPGQPFQDILGSGIESLHGESDAGSSSEVMSRAAQTAKYLKTLVQKKASLPSDEYGLDNSPLESRTSASTTSHTPNRDNSYRPQDKLEWFWFCHKCGDGPMSTELVSACPQYHCNHWRCEDCLMELHKMRGAS